jgi:carbamoyltransferase
MKPVYVLGVGLSHNGSACLLKDGKIAVAIEKERITRIKHDGLNDAHCVKYVLEAEGIAYEDLTLVVQNGINGFFEAGNTWFEGERPHNGSVPVASITHHKAHAYSVIGTMPFRTANIQVIDGMGSAFKFIGDEIAAELVERPSLGLEHLYSEVDSFYHYDGKRLRPLFKNYSPLCGPHGNLPFHSRSAVHTIGGFYGAAGRFMFGVAAAGKLMGLAPYGEPVYDFPIYDCREGRVFLNYDWMPQFYKYAVRHPDQFKENFQIHANIAYHIQKETERALLYIHQHRRTRSPSEENFAYAGGVALNAVANYKLLKHDQEQATGYKNHYFMPAAGDNGAAIGCAYYGWMEVLKQERLPYDGSMFLGKNHITDRMVIPRSMFRSSYKSKNVVEDAAQLLAAGNIIGWYQGRSEFGPRALGNRSILADPRLPGIKDRINHRVKFREDFRPLAPSVTAESRERYFQGNFPSPYMNVVDLVRDPTAMPGVTHRDHTARLQTVTKDFNPLYHSLISRFGQITNVPVLLNTSLNKRAMPIVETPEEAGKLFLESGLDFMVIGDWVLGK